jgi:hypothetical protein
MAFQEGKKEKYSISHTCLQKNVGYALRVEGVGVKYQINKIPI